MKKLLLFLPIFFFCFSCSESDDLIAPVSKDDASRPGPVINRTDPTKLAKVTFNPNTAYTRQWYFYPNGLLKRIANAAGAVQVSFTYDIHNNLSKTFYANGSYDRFFYDSGNHIIQAVQHTSVGSSTEQPVYSQDGNKYVYGDVNSPVHTEILLSPDGLFLKATYYYQDEDENGIPFNIIETPEQAYYNSNNMSGYTVDSNPDPYVGYSHDDKINPLKQAIYSICKAYAPLFYSPMISDYYLHKRSDYNSQNNLVSWVAGSLDRGEYDYNFNADNLPTVQHYRNYFQNNLDSSGIGILYYYQGDIIPN